MNSPLQKEWESLLRREGFYLRKSGEKSPSKLEQLLAQKVPPKLQEALDSGFSAAFTLIFERGTGVLEQTYSREEAKQDYARNSHIAKERGDRRSLGRFTKAAERAGQKNLLLTGLEGVGLGVLGIGLPDIPLFTGMLLKCVYETALHYGFDYESTEEKYLVLQIIETALSHGEALLEGNQAINHFIETGQLPAGYSQAAQIKKTAAALSTELLYMKFLQGLPLVGAVGGLYNPVYLHWVQQYATLKYTRRFLHDRRMREGGSL